MAAAKKRPNMEINPVSVSHTHTHTQTRHLNKAKRNVAERNKKFIQVARLTCA